MGKSKQDIVVDEALVARLRTFMNSGYGGGYSGFCRLYMPDVRPGDLKGAVQAWRIAQNRRNAGGWPERVRNVSTYMQRKKVDCSDRAYLREVGA